MIMTYFIEIMPAILTGSHGNYTINAKSTIMNALPLQYNQGINAVVGLGAKNMPAKDIRHWLTHI